MLRRAVAKLGAGGFISRSMAVGLLAASLIAVPTAGPSLAATATTTLVSKSSGGTIGNEISFWPAVSDNGQFVTFTSQAANLVPSDTNGEWDVFVHDRTTGGTTLVSVSSAGEQGDGPSGGGLRPTISADGRFVAFVSAATNLVAGDTNGSDDAFVHDRATGGTRRVSVSSTGEQGDDLSGITNTISADGRFVAFVSNATNLVAGDTNGRQDAFVHDLQTGTTTRVSVSSEGAQGDHRDAHPGDISSSGRFIAFWSDATNHVVGDTNGRGDVFVHDLQTGTTTRVSVSSEGAQGDGDVNSLPTISGEGRYVSFVSEAANLVPGDTNGVSDVFVHDRATGATARVSVSSAGMQGDLAAGRANGGSAPGISEDGRYVSFLSEATNLVAGDTNGRDDVFLHDRQTGTTTRVSVSSSGSQQGPGVGSLDDIDSGPAISGDGRVITFQSGASNLVAGDTNGVGDVFVHDLGPVNANADPDCSGAAPNQATLWPPNHRMVNVTVDGVTDPDGDTVTITIDSIFQDEVVNGPGDGNTAPDGLGVGTSIAQVRAERSGGGNGRVYHIGFSANDGLGGTCSGEVLVGVPKAMGKVPIDNGALYDSTVG